MVSGTTICLYSIALLRLIQWSSVQEDPDLFDWKSAKIATLSNEYLQIFLVGVATYLLALRGVWVITESLIKDSGIVRDFWIIPIAILVAIYFLLTQYSFNRKYSSIKHSRLEKLRHLQQEAFDRWNSNHNKEDADAVLFIGELIEKVEHEKTWPLDVPRMLTVLVPVFAPTLGEVAEIFSLLFPNG